MLLDQPYFSDAVRLDNGRTTGPEAPASRKSACKAARCSKRSSAPLCAGPRRSGARRDPIEYRDHVLDVGAFVILGDEYDLAAVVGVRPAVKPRKVVQKMLRTLDNGRAVGLLGDVDDAFTRRRLAPRFCCRASSNRRSASRVIGSSRMKQNEAMSRSCRPWWSCGVIVTGMIMMIVMIMRLVGRGVQPRARVGLRVGRVETR